MFVKITMYQNGNAVGGGTLVSDSTSGLVAVSTTADGSWQRNVNNGSTGTVTQTLYEHSAASWAIDAGSSIQDPAGNNKTLLQENPYTTYTLYYS